MRCARPRVYALAVLSLFTTIVFCQATRLPLAQRYNGELFPKSETGTTAVSNAHTASKASLLATTTQRVSISVTMSASSSAPTAFSSSGDMTEKIYAGGMPIVPRITPGLSVGGVILMLTGLAYCLIGIKIKRLHIFLSTAYLTSLGITVLIIYVMHPPVKDAIQGAYLTAIVVTGSALGGLAIVFPEVTEGLGCLLGGFCLAMWFLVLKPGGLITSLHGKVIMIIVMSVVVFALAFHRFTRPYGLIGSLSFAGSTAIVLGMDCFTRAGLKEFWLYIWALNDNLFPLNTNTYPHTRGIRVEIAATVLIAGLGVISQIKLWRILKEHRTLKDSEKRQQEADLDAMDEDVGKRVEAVFQVERAQWEATYGAKGTPETTVDERPLTGRSRADSGIGDVDDLGRKARKSNEFVETEEMKKGREENIAMTHLASTGVGLRRLTGTTITVDVDRITPLEASEGGSRRHSPLPSRRQSGQSSRSKATSSVLEPLAESPEIKHRVVPPTPPIIPLPIPLLQMQESEEDGDDESFAATRAEEDGVGGLALEVASNCGVPNIEFLQDDKASSVAATWDGYMEGDLRLLKDMDSHHSSVVGSAENENSSPYEQDGRHPDPEALETEPMIKGTGSIVDFGEIGTVKMPDFATFTTPEESDVRAGDSITPGTALEDPTTRSSLEKSAFQAPDSGFQTVDTSPVGSLPPASVASKASQRKARLPDDLAPASFPKSSPESVPSGGSPSVSARVQTHCSKIVKTYRTNEWAKHLSEADRPDLDDLDKPEINSIEEKEIPAPLNVNELKETAEVSFQPSQSSNSFESSIPSPAPHKLSIKKRILTEKPLTHTPPTATPEIPVPLITRSSSAQSRPEQRQSTPIDRSMISPIEENNVTPVDRSASAAGRHELAAFPPNTLMGQRQSLAHSKTSFNTLDQYSTMPESSSPATLHNNRRSASAMNLARRTSAMNALNGIRHVQSSGNVLSPLGRNEAAVNSQATKHTELDDDMTLSRRRTELLHHSASQQSIRVPSAVVQQGQPHNSPDQRTKILKSWRESIQAEQLKKNDTRNVDQRHADMVNRYNHAALKERQKAVQENLKEGYLEDRMRHPNMLEMHKEALRKMQANANKHL